jgi:hypothetical protein
MTDAVSKTVAPIAAKIAEERAAFIAGILFIMIPLSVSGVSRSLRFRREDDSAHHTGCNGHTAAKLTTAATCARQHVLAERALLRKLGGRIRLTWEATPCVALVCF